MYETQTEGKIEKQTFVDETGLPQLISEDKNLEILARVARITGYAQTLQSLLEGILLELVDAFPRAERRTILLYEEDEPMPRFCWPPDRSYISFTLVKEVKKRKIALHWKRADQKASSIPSSLGDALAALYAPMICNNKVIGVIHLDSTSNSEAFKEIDLELLSIIAITLGPSVEVIRRDSLVKLPGIFISYAHEDKKVIRRVANDLRRRKIKVWLDERLKVGKQWQMQLASTIEITDAFVIALSPQSVSSQTVQWELEFALAKGKEVIPLLLEPCDIPQAIASLQYVEVTTNLEEWLDNLAERIYEIREDKC